MNAQLLAEILQAPAKRVAPWALLVGDVCRVYEIDTVQRAACFVAQFGHETGRLRYLRELWGPTPQQLKYEPVTTLSRRLGNTRPGDGRLYLGRGLFQYTGAANYAALTRRLRRRFPNSPDFTKEPVLLERPFWAAMSAGDYWDMRGLNRFADAFDFAELTRRINGGYHGLADRTAIYNRAFALLTFFGG